MMRTRKLGTGGLEVSAVGLGCMGLNHHRGAVLASSEAIATKFGFNLGGAAGRGQLDSRPERIRAGAAGLRGAGDRLRAL
jgi:hypothetical protein